MALTVLQAPRPEPYDHWREDLAASILVPMLTSAIEGQRQRDANRKINALGGEVQRQLAELQGMAGTQQAQQGASLLSGLPEPEGYNSNGWQRAFHKQDSPLAQFDAGMTSLLPPITQTQGQGRIPTQADAQGIISQLNSFLAKLQ